MEGVKSLCHQHLWRRLKRQLGIGYTADNEIVLLWINKGVRYMASNMLLRKQQPGDCRTIGLRLTLATQDAECELLRQSAVNISSSHHAHYISLSYNKMHLEYDFDRLCQDQKSQIDFWPSRGLICSHQLKRLSSSDREVLTVALFVHSFHTSHPCWNPEQYDPANACATPTKQRSACLWLCAQIVGSARDQLSEHYEIRAWNHANHQLGNLHLNCFEDCKTRHWDFLIS